MKKLTFSLLCMLLSIAAFAQFDPKVRDSLNRLSNEDHKIMMEKLGISEIRPGPSGNPEAENAANSDEFKASPYITLPNPLLFNDSSLVTSAADWEKRRKEIVEDFDREVYGRLPAQVPGVTWKIVEEKDTVNAEYAINVKKLAGVVDNSSYPDIEVTIDMTLTLPAQAKGPVPVVIHYGFNWPPGFFRNRPQPPGPTWQQQLLAQGWGYAVLIPTSFQADNGAGLTRGIIGLVNKGERRKPDDWGTLRAWAWGASRAIDYFEADARVDEKRIAIEGLSRYGKAANVAMAYEPRLSIGFIGSSGAGGTKILRRVYGEQVENLAGSGEYHWFAGNFIKYAGPLTPNDLPVDAHQLVALCAPRPVFVSVGSPFVEGRWIDAKGMFLATSHASPVYELLGKKGLGMTIFPPLGTNLASGDLAFRQHEGGHTTGPNWPYFIEFARRYWK